MSSFHFPLTFFFSSDLQSSPSSLRLGRHRPVIALARRRICVREFAVTGVVGRRRADILPNRLAALQSGRALDLISETRAASKRDLHSGRHYLDSRQSGRLGEEQGNLGRDQYLWRNAGLPRCRCHSELATLERQAVI